MHYHLKLLTHSSGNAIYWKTEFIQGHNIYIESVNKWFIGNIILKLAKAHLFAHS